MSNPNQPPKPGQPFNPQYPSGQYPPVPQQGYPQSAPQQNYQQPPMMPPAQPPKKKAWYKRPWGIALLIFLTLGLCGGISNAFSSASSASQSTPVTQASTTAPVRKETPMPTAQPVHYPPTTLADLRSLASQGDANRIHEFHSESVGAVGVCPQPRRQVSVEPNLTEKQLAQDLLAYFYTQHLDTPCGSLVLAYHTQADIDDPNTGGVYTAGRIKFDVTDARGTVNFDPNGRNLKRTLTLDIGGGLATYKEYAVTY